MTTYRNLQNISDIEWESIPHLVLPAPHQAYCLTPILPSDEQVVGQTLNVEAVRSTFGLGPQDEQGLHEFLERRRDYDHVCLEIPVIRTVESLQTPLPDFVGMFIIHREGFRVLYGTEDTQIKLDRIAANKALPKDEAQWQMAFFIHPEHGRKGVMQAAGEAYLKHCPHIRTRPGMVSGGWLQHNGASRRCQERLGFRPFGKKPKVWKDWTAIAGLWMGGGEIEKRDTILAEMLDVTEEDLEADRRQDAEWRERRTNGTRGA